MKKGLGKGLAALIGDLDEDIDSQGIKDEAGLGVGLSLIHISEPTRLRRISYAVFCLKKKKSNKIDQ